MDVQIDRTKVYTSGDWIRGTVCLESSIHDLKNIHVELRGIVSRRGILNKPTNTNNTKFFTLKTKVDPRDMNALSSEQVLNQSFDFTIQFPEPDGKIKLPASTLCLEFITEFEIRYLITVTVVRRGTLSRNLQRTVEVEFMPSASLGLILDPDVVYYEKFGDKKYTVEISMPRFLAQENAPNRVLVKILQFQHTAKYELESVEASIYVLGYVGTKQFTSRSCSPVCELLAGNLIELTFQRSYNLSPAFSLSGVTLNYELALHISFVEVHTQTRYENSFVKPIDILPTSLYKSHHHEFALPNEIARTCKLKYGRILRDTSPLLENHASTSTAHNAASQQQSADEPRLPTYLETLSPRQAKPLKSHCPVQFEQH